MVSTDGNVKQHLAQSAFVGISASGARLKLPAELKPMTDVTGHHKLQVKHLSSCCCRLRERLLLRPQELSDLLAMHDSHQ